MPWIVKLVKTPTINDFRSSFFPRSFAYKKDAEGLRKEVNEKGGEAIIVKEERRAK